MDLIRMIGGGGPLGAVTGMINMMLVNDFVDPMALLQTVQPSDLLEFHRGAYKHWAMYYGKIGNEHFIINVPAEGFGQSEVEIKRQKFLEIAGISPVRVNNQEEEANKRGLRKRSAQDALRAAEQDLGKRVPYNFIGKNCEYYSTKWLYGNGFSTQVHNVQKVVTGDWQIVKIPEKNNN